MSLLTTWSRLVIGSLASAGVRDVVVSPGSRSTPFVLAAARHGGLRVHEVIDERAAGFFALGLARLGGPPPLLLCTSGTAPAHYYPAIVEASLAELPLVALTADRPPELADCGAPQTIDQTRLFGAHARLFADLGAPDPEALEGLRRLISQAVLRSRYPIPGPVQLNARARKPLEPRSPASAGERALEERARAIAERPLALR
ncbi:MAG: 2-succinyl-5-enolpyruvyl-6-hydroxy-3-cyclohexene-1-carboxylate synthase, partial [Sandaracinaceae bacterium]|nr:2-succinyl-5-enolpyruvyl-6-hydroxy-3-cyclohexene-1-carboxylate synthase [Sandaracinaceae bacterium]